MQPAVFAWFLPSQLIHLERAPQHDPALQEATAKGCQWAYCRHADLSAEDFAAVVGAAGRGEHWALTELFRAYQPQLVRFLRGQDPRVADDLAAEVWSAVARRLSSFDGDELGFRRWLFTIARCLLIDHHRKEARRRTEPVSHERFDIPDDPGGRDDPAVLVAERLSAQEAIDLAVEGLTPDQAEAVLLRVVAGLDVATVAGIMNRSPGSVRVLCHRALRRMAARFSTGVLTR